MIERSEIDRLLKTDISTMTREQALAVADLLYQHVRRLQRAYLQVLEANPALVAEHPRLQNQLDHLRTLDLGEPD